MQSKMTAFLDYCGSFVTFLLIFFHVIDFFYYLCRQNIETMDIYEISIHLEKPNTLRELFPQEKHSHVSLTLSGDLGEDDIRLLTGYSNNSYIDEDTLEEFYIEESDRWETIDLNLSKIDSKSLERLQFRRIKGLMKLVLPIGYINVNVKDWFSNDEEVTVCHLVISEGSQKIGKDSFNGWRSLKDVQFPKSLNKIAPEAFVGCSSLEAFVFPDGSDHFKVCDGVLFSSDGLMLIAFPPGLERDEYVIPEGTTIIAESAFKHNPHIKKVIIPKTVVQIQAYAFENCASLKQIDVAPANYIYKSSNGILIEKDVPVLLPIDDIYIHERALKILCVPAAFDKAKFGFNKFGLNNVLLAHNCFAGCRFVKTFYFNGGAIKPDIYGAFSSANSIEELTLENVKEMPNLTWCNKLKILNIKGYISGSIKDSVSSRYNDALKAVNIEEDAYRANLFYSVDGVVFTKNHELYFYPPAKEDDKYVVPENTTNISYWSCIWDNPFIGEVVLPSSFDLEKIRKEWNVEEPIMSSSITINKYIDGADVKHTTIRFTIKDKTD